jgi:ricin-type beta-trefoil lectin protein
MLPERAGSPQGVPAMSRIHIGLLTVLIILGAIGTPADAAQIVITNSVECVDIPHGQAVDGSPLSLFNCHGSPNQQWTIANGQITGMSGVCLDVMGSAAKDGAQAIIVHCNGGVSEKWTLANGQIIGIGGKCLDVAGGNPQDHAMLIISSCSSSPSQQWSVQ